MANIDEQPEETPSETSSEQTNTNKPVNVAKEGWKSSLAFGKVKPMPPSDWKKKKK